MKIVEAGHRYALKHVDSDGYELLTFIRRNSSAITHESEHPGTNVQEVLRALIDRSLFLDDVIPAPETMDAVWHLRMALFSYEARAYRRKQQKLNRKKPEHEQTGDRYDDVPFTEHEIENHPVGPDGHLLIEQ